MRSYAQLALRIALGIVVALAAFVAPTAAATAAPLQTSRAQSATPQACAQATALTTRAKAAKRRLVTLKAKASEARAAKKPARAKTLQKRAHATKKRVKALTANAVTARKACAATKAAAPTTPVTQDPQTTETTPVVQDPTTLGPFYRTPTTLPATNGALVRSETATFVLDPIVKVKPPSKTFRVMYRSTNRTGTPIAVTGTVLVPKTTWTGKGQRPIVGYAAGTQGLADKCAPSYALTTGTEYESVFIAGLLARGYAVAMTDYEGLGTDGAHTYMTRDSQGHAVLDAVRAAQHLTAANVPANGPIALTGYSQGGGASAAAAELAPSYAPELKIKGVAVGAVPGDLNDVGANLDGSLYFGFLGYAIVGVTAAYNLPLDLILNDRGRAAVTRLKGECTVESILNWGFTESKDLTQNGQPISELLKAPVFADMVAQQKIGNTKPVNVPILVTHSLLDDVIPYQAGKAVATSWCKKGSNVYFATIATPTHVGGAIASYPRVFTFLESRFGTLPNVAVSNCWLL